MAINRLKPGYISNITHDGSNAANETLVAYSSANNRVEFLSLTADTTDRDLVSSNLDAYAAQLDANVNSISSNVDTLVAGVDASEVLVNTVSGNVDSFATYANSTFVTEGTSANSFTSIEIVDVTADTTRTGIVTANVSADELTFVAGNGISFTANTASQEITIAAKLNAILNDRYTADGSANTFTLSRAVTNHDEIIVSVDGIVQVPNTNYTVSSTTLTLANSLPIINGTLVDVRHLPVTGSEGELKVIPPLVYQGETAGYALTGYNQPSSAPSPSDVIEKILYTSDTNAVDIAEGGVGNDSIYGGGITTNDVAYQVYSAGPSYAGIKRFPYATETLSSQLDSAGPADSGMIAGASSTTAGYIHGGNGGAANNLSKFPFATETIDGDIGSLASSSTGGHAAHQSETFGYISGGRGSPGNLVIDVIQKYSLSSDSGTTDIGETASADRLKGTVGSSSTTAGYRLGGASTNDQSSTNIDKFPFSSDASATDVAELTGNRFNGGAGSSTTSGYYIGGASTNNTGSNVIEKFPFSSDAPAASVGSLVIYRRGGNSLAND
jgi:hypothetical protein